MCYVTVYEHVYLDEHVCVQVSVHGVSNNALLWYREFPSQRVSLMFASGAHVQHNTKYKGLFSDAGL